MVSLVLLSHSRKIVEGTKELAEEMAREAPIFVAGGTDDGSMGSSYELIKDTIEKAFSADGVIILYDLGSSAMTAALVLDDLDEQMRARIKLMNAPLVEGAVAAAVEINSGANLEDVEMVLKEIEMIK